MKKHQTRFTSMDDKILFLYAQGMTTREIVDTFKEMYGADVSASLISKVTDAVIDQVVEWQSWPLDAVYPIVYLDCIVVKIRQDKHAINKAVYLALGVNMDDHKELLGLWLSENEGSKFWLNVLTELQNRGVKDILIACIDGLKGFPDAINAVFLETQIQLCIAHMVRNSVKYAHLLFLLYLTMHAVHHCNSLRAVYSFELGKISCKNHFNTLTYSRSEQSNSVTAITPKPISLSLFFNCFQNLFHNQFLFHSDSYSFTHNAAHNCERLCESSTVGARCWALL